MVALPPEGASGLAEGTTRLGDSAVRLVAPIGSRAGSGRMAGIRHSLDIYIPAAVLVVILFFCFLWPLIYTIPPPVGGSILDAGLPIGSPGHILGTDTVGNDIMSRLLYGGRVSFELVAAVQLIGLVVGGGIGVFCASLSGLSEAVVMRVIDVLIAFPAVVLVLAIVDGLGAGEVHLIWALSAISIPSFARLARSAAIGLREQTFVVAAGLSGTSPTRIVLRHVIPNILPQMLTFSCLGAAVVVVLEATLSFFGYGIPAPGPSWGNMIAIGQQTMIAQPLLVIIPSCFLFVTVVALNTLGDGLRAHWGVQ
ncbi:MAG TPA: ABC transporter permease [Acidimicrobiales bacterium]|nr:ABC transporter permease [Acidimicrobiales bacterium]